MAYNWEDNLRRLTEQELQRLIKKAVKELLNRQKAKHSAIYREAEAALASGDKDLYNKHCGSLGRNQATEDILKEFLDRF